jgi:CubicO group peptidase (beta-lactamase class C family)
MRPSRHSRTPSIIALTVCAAVFPEATVAQDVALPAIDELVRVEMAEQDIPSVAAAVVTAEDVVWSNVYGHADVESGRRATASTQYTLSSISKLFVAVAIMKLVEQGEVELAEEASTYLGFPLRNPKFPDEPLTVEHLMTHRASLANPGANLLPSYYDLVESADLPEMADYLRSVLTRSGEQYVRDMWFDQPPGSFVSSSNIGVSILAQVVESVSGERLDEFLRREVFTPLGIPGVAYRSTDENRADFATVYVPGAGAFREVNQRAFAPGQARASIGELSRFMMAMMRGGELDGARVLSPETTREMLAIRYPDANVSFGAGSGLLWRGFGDNEWIGHTGGGGVATASFDFHPELGVGVIIVTNAGQKRTVSPFGAIYEALHEEAVRLSEGSAAAR